MKQVNITINVPIVSAAIDGERCAEAIHTLNSLKNL